MEKIDKAKEIYTIFTKLLIYKADITQGEITHLKSLMNYVIAKNDENTKYYFPTICIYNRDIQKTIKFVKKYKLKFTNLEKFNKENKLKCNKFKEKSQFLKDAENLRKALINLEEKLKIYKQDLFALLSPSNILFSNFNEKKKV